MRTKWESSQACLSESIVTQPWVKPETTCGRWLLETQATP